MILAHDLNKTPRTQDIQTLSSADITFRSMLLTKETLDGLEISGFSKPSPIQLHGIPLGKCGFDLFLEAKSGTGKTAVFTVIALEKLDLQKDLQTIILAPTREIAAQISDVIKQVGSMYKGLNVEVVMGGLPVEEDIKKFQKTVHILVGSPGRMRQLIQEQHVNISAVRLFVLDEADKLMEKSFQPDINYIFSVLPKQKQVIMSSATYPGALRSVMQNYVQKVQHIRPDSTAILLGIKQLVTTIRYHPNIVKQTLLKFQELLRILSQRDFKQCLIFCNYQNRVLDLCKMLLSAKWPAEQLHGQLEQTVRLDALKTLQQYKCRILVSTDLAARGIDASNVDLVINFEPPFEWQTYLHRMGRAGRFGSYGISITILSEGKEVTKFKAMVNNISSSLIINNLWDNRKFNSVRSDSKCASPRPVSNISKEKISNSTVIPIAQEVQDSCEEICEKDECNIESLSMLLDSVKTSQENKIESFDDLMTSLDVHNHSDKENETENLNNFTETILTTPNITVSHQVFCDLEQETGDKNGENFAQNLKFEKDEVHNGRKIPMPDYKTKISSPKDVRNQRDLVKATPDVDDSHIALIEAGLPTSFGSSKRSNKNDFNQPRLHKNKKSVTPQQKLVEKSQECKIESFDDLMAYLEVDNQSDEENEIETLNQNLKDEVHNSKKFTISVYKTHITCPKESSNHRGLVKSMPDISDSHIALKEAELTTSFGASKQSNKNNLNQPRFCNKKSVAPLQKPNIKTSIHLESDESNTKETRETNHEKYVTNNNLSCRDGYDDTQSGCFERFAKSVRTQDNTDTFSYLRKTDNYITCDKYSKWYRQLKTHIKQVEMSMYIGELSKI